MGKIIEKVRQREFDAMLSRGIAYDQAFRQDLREKEHQKEALELAGYACGLATNPVSASKFAFLEEHPTMIHYRWHCL